MKKHINNRSLKERDTTISILLVMILGFFIISPYQQGLFNGGRFQFEEPIYYTVLFASIVLVMSCGYIILKKIHVSRMALITIGTVCMLPVSYTISYINAVTPHYALISIMISWVWVSFFIVSLLINRTTVGRDTMVHGIILATYILVIGGFLNWFGQLEWRDAVLSGRLSNVFQYPNTYAIILMSILFSQLHLVTHAERSSRLLVNVHRLMIVPVIVSFFLTLSRGALIILPIMVIVYLILCTVEKQIKSLLYSGITLLLGLIVIGPLTTIRTELTTDYTLGTSMQGWLLLLIVTLFGGAMIWLIEWYWRRIKFINSIIQIIRYQWVLPVIVLLLTIVSALLIVSESRLISVLPDSIENRILSIELSDASSTQRLTYYKDAWSIFKDYPLFGAGGGGWSKLYTEYQSYPYIGNQAHSFYLQTLNETGLIGLLIFLSLLIIIFYMYTKHYLKEQILDHRNVYLLISTPILIHSFLDFHMSFVYIAALVFFCLGGMLPNLMQDRSSDSQQFRNTKITKNSIGIILIVGSLMFVVISLRFIETDQEYEMMLEKQSYEHLVKALELRPNHPDLVNLAVGSLIAQYDDTKDVGALEQASAMVEQQRLKEPRNTSMIELQGELLERQNNAAEAFEVYEKLIEMTPWSTRGYEKKIDLQYKMGEADPLWWDEAINQYMDLVKLIEGLKVLGQFDSNMYNLLNIETRIAQIYYQRGLYIESWTLLEKYAQTKHLILPEHRTAIRWYLATTNKINIINLDIYNQFIQSYPTEAEEINRLLSINTHNR